MVDGTVTEAFLLKYRHLLDAEEAAFDDLEHAVEDGDRANYEADLVAWIDAAQRRSAFLADHHPVAAVQQR